MNESEVAGAARLSVAPMMDWTDSHCRQFHRMLSRRALLYTEMVTAAAVVHGNRSRLLDFDAVEHPLDRQQAALLGHGHVGRSGVRRH